MHVPFSKLFEFGNFRLGRICTGSAYTKFTLLIFCGVSIKIRIRRKGENF